MKLNSVLKRQFYILSFTSLGVLVGILVYGIGSIVLIKYQKDLNLSVYLWVMLISGGLVGFSEGRYWWDIIYVKKSL
jgi:high-affinity nickel permease